MVAGYTVATWDGICDTMGYHVTPRRWAFDFDLEAQAHGLRQASQLAVDLRQRITGTGPVQRHGALCDGHTR